MKRDIMYDFVLPTVLVVMACTLVGVVIMDALDNNSDDAPSWARDTAKNLEVHGGRVALYRTSGDTTSTTYTVIIDPGYTVLASSTGLTVCAYGGVQCFPYERIAGVYINGEIE